MPTESEFKESLKRLPRDERMVTLYLLEQLSQFRSLKFSLSQGEIEENANRVASLWRTMDGLKGQLDSIARSVQELSERKLRAISNAYDVRIEILANDCFRHAPFAETGIVVSVTKDYPFLPIYVTAPYDRAEVRTVEDRAEVTIAAEILSFIIGHPLVIVYSPGTQIYSITTEDRFSQMQSDLRQQEKWARQDGLRYIDECENWLAKPNDLRGRDSILISHLTLAIVENHVAYEELRRTGGKGITNVDELKTWEGVQSLLANTLARRGLKVKPPDSSGATFPP